MGKNGVNGDEPEPSGCENDIDHVKEAAGKSKKGGWWGRSTFTKIEYTFFQQTLKYAYFALAKVLSKLTRKTTDAMQNEAIGIFELLMERFPSFRYEEVRLILARDYYNTGRKRDAVYLFNKLLSERPYLKDNKNFINEKIFAEEGNVKAIAEWWRNNRAGIDKDMVHIKMEE